MSFGQKALMKKSKPTTVSINRGTIVDQVASFLHATHMIPDRKEITDIKFGDTSGDQVTLEIFTRKEVSKKH
jgi:hypothetical protein